MTFIKKLLPGHWFKNVHIVRGEFLVTDFFKTASKYFVELSVKYVTLPNLKHAELNGLSSIPIKPLAVV